MGKEDFEYPANFVLLELENLGDSGINRILNTLRQTEPEITHYRLPYALLDPPFDGFFSHLDATRPDPRLFQWAITHTTTFRAQDESVHEREDRGYYSAERVTRIQQALKDAQSEWQLCPDEHSASSNTYLLKRGRTKSSQVSVDFGFQSELAELPFRLMVQKAMIESATFRRSPPPPQPRFHTNVELKTDWHPVTHKFSAIQARALINEHSSALRAMSNALLTEATELQGTR